jgi:hypothetical protein
MVVAVHDCERKVAADEIVDAVLEVKVVYHGGDSDPTGGCC